MPLRQGPPCPVRPLRPIGLEDLNASVSVAFPMIHLALRHTQRPKPPGWNQSCRGLTLKKACEVHMEIWLPSILCSVVKELGELFVALSLLRLL